jgi:hypothetical protein
VTEAPASPRRETADIQVDGRDFRIHLAGPDEPGEVEVSTGERIRLRRWGFDEHLRALDRHAWADGAGLQFDAGGFARDVLRDSGVPDALFDELAPVALWWATGGAAPRGARAEADGWVRAGQVRARLRPWTFSERSQALGVSMTSRADGSRELSLECYLRAMLAASVVALEPPGVELAALDGASAALLLDAVASLNHAGERAEDLTVKSADGEARALAELTLRLCRALGWTPSQVWAAPAAEIDRLLALLQLTEPPPPAPAPAARPPRLSEYPDAVVIQVEDG